jgi:hypothetical protein
MKNIIKVEDKFYKKIKCLLLNSIDRTDLWLSRHGKLHYQEAYRLARLVQWAESNKEMNLSYKEFKKYVDSCK